jgi:hypothetical protein
VGDGPLVRGRRRTAAADFSVTKRDIGKMVPQITYVGEAALGEPVQDVEDRGPAVLLDRCRDEFLLSGGRAVEGVPDRVDDLETGDVVRRVPGICHGRDSTVTSG